MATTIELLKNYDWGISRTELLKTEYHCPNCGEKKVYVEDNEGDYYQGQRYHCIAESCSSEFTMPCIIVSDKKKHIVITEHE